MAVMPLFKNLDRPLPVREQLDSLAHDLLAELAENAARLTGRRVVQILQRLEAFPTIIVERNERPGDSWRKRYKSLCLHDPVWYDHLPYIKFPENWPVFSPKDKIGDWLEMYTQGDGAQLLGLDRLPRARRYDEDAGEWTVVVERDGADDHAAARSSWCSRPACRASRTCPRSPGMDVFKGDQHHSSPAPGPGRLRGQDGAS